MGRTRHVEDGFGVRCQIGFLGEGVGELELACVVVCLQSWNVSLVGERS